MSLLHPRSAVCCHGCGSITEDPLLSAVADSLSVDPTMADIRAELEFGHVDGTLLRFPTPQPPGDCALEHSHLQLVQNTFIHGYIHIHVYHIYVASSFHVA